MFLSGGSNLHRNHPGSPPPRHWPTVERYIPCPEDGCWCTWTTALYRALQLQQRQRLVTCRTVTDGIPVVVVTKAIPFDPLFLSFSEIDKTPVSHTIPRSYLTGDACGDISQTWLWFTRHSCYFWKITDISDEEIDERAFISHKPWAELPADIQADSIFESGAIPDSNVVWTNVGPTLGLSSRHWPNVSPSYIVVWSGQEALWNRMGWTKQMTFQSAFCKRSHQWYIETGFDNDLALDTAQGCLRPLWPRSISWGKVG